MIVLCEACYIHHFHSVAVKSARQFSFWQFRLITYWLEIAGCGHYILLGWGSGDDSFLICVFFSLNSNDKRFLSLHSSMQHHLSLIYIF